MVILIQDHIVFTRNIPWCPYWWHARVYDVFAYWATNGSISSRLGKGDNTIYIGALTC